MRKTRLLILGAALLTLSAGQAHAAALQYSGVLAVQVATLAPIGITGVGTAIVNGSGAPGHLTALQVGGGAFATAGFELPVTDPGAAPIKGLQVTLANAPGNFGGLGFGAGGGAMPLAGAVKVCLFGACSAAVANLNVPLAPVGAGGFAQVTAAVNLTVIGAPWTTGTVAVGTISAMGGGAPFSNTGAPSGIVTLVTPVFVSTNISSSAVVPVFGFLNLHFVPEPGTLVLLGSGIASLLWFGGSARKRG